MSELTVKELERIYNENNWSDACLKIGVCGATLSSMLKEHKIKRKGSGRTKKITIIKG